MTKLIFATPVSIWWILASWPAILLAIAWLYRREWSELPRSSAVALYLLRSLAATLLLLCLAQPVWETRSSKELSLPVPILIDNSRSMWYPDPHRHAAEKVELAERLDFLEPGLRFKFEEALRRPLAKAQEALGEVGDEGLDFALEPNKSEIASLEERFESFIDLADHFAQMEAKLQDAASGQALLSPAIKESARLALRAVVHRAEALRQSWKKLERLETVTGSDCRRIEREIRLGREDAENFLKGLHTYQTRADEELAKSDRPEVRSAIDAISESNRMELVLRVLREVKDPLLPQLQSKNDKCPVYAFGSDGALDPDKALKLDSLKLARVGRTDLPAEFTRLFGQASKGGSMRQVILISDGRDNSGANETELIEVLKKRQLKVIALGVGSRAPIPDVAVLSAQMPQRVFDGDKVTLKTKLKLVGRHDSPVRVRVLSAGRVVCTDEVPDDVARDELGCFDFELEFKVKAELKPDRVEVISNDSIPENNSQPVDCWIRKEQIRVLFLDEFPRWESRYLNMMLRRDKRMDLERMRVIFLGSLKDGRLTRGPGSQQFPPNKEGLLEFDLLILGDLPPDTFTPEEMGNLVSFVKDRAGTIIFLAGQSSMPSAYFSSPLHDLLPVERVRRTALPKAGMRMALTAEGKEAGLVRPYQGPTSAAGHGKLHWVRSDTRNIPTASVLTQEPMTGLPVVITSLYGAGKVLYLGSDEFWRWRYRSGWKYHHEFWSLVLLWATSEKIEGESRFAKLGLDQRRFSTSENPDVRLKLIGADGKPLEGSQGSVCLTGKTTDGTDIERAIPYQVVDLGGLYRAELGRLPTGKYRVSPMIDELEGEDIDAALEFEVVEESSLENLYIRQNQPFLQRLCEETGGRYFDLQDFGALPEAVQTDRVRIESKEETELWDKYWMLLLVATLLVTEWAFRKRHNLV